MTVTQFLEYAAWLKEVPSADISRRVDDALDAADLAGVGRRRLGHLSGGMLRRVGIAQAIVHRPDFLVLDEPTVGLDPEQRAAFHERVPVLGRERTVLVSTHLLEDVTALAERTVILEGGTVAFSGSLEELAAVGDGGDDLTERLRSGFLAVVTSGAPG
jgi:ABC-2 type transport system ATP-binding protein